MEKSNIDYTELIKSQKLTKPAIDDIIGLFLERERLELAQNFLAFLREHGINTRWASANKWMAGTACEIQLGGNKMAAGRTHFGVGDWHIAGLEGKKGIEREYLQQFIGDDEVVSFVHANIKACTRCASCGPRAIEYAGKMFDECCLFVILNPDAKGLEITKQLVLANKLY